jgi:hypothetical protein
MSQGQCAKDVSCHQELVLSALCCKCACQSQDGHGRCWRNNQTVCITCLHPLCAHSTLCALAAAGAPDTSAVQIIPSRTHPRRSC